MPFQPGNKLGIGHKGARLIEEALRRAIAQDNGNRIRKGVEALLDLAAGGDLAAFQIIADRLDGKPTQQVEMSVSRADPPELTEDELKRIAAGSSPGVALPAPGEEVISELH